MKEWSQLDYTYDKDFISQCITAFIYTKVDSLENTHLRIAHLVMGRDSILKNSYPDLCIYSFLWDIAKLHIGWSKFDKLLMSYYEEIFNNLIIQYNLPKINLADLTEILITNQTVLDDTDLLEMVSKRIGYNTINRRIIQTRFEELLNGN